VQAVQAKTPDVRKKLMKIKYPSAISEEKVSLPSQDDS
jgi:hypothetical protein